MACNIRSQKKFRFDSFATEFASDKDDNDSGVGKLTISSQIQDGFVLMGQKKKNKNDTL